MVKQELDSVCIIGLGLLGGSVALAVNRAYPRTRRIGYSHREVTRRKALQAGTVDVVYPSACRAVADAQLVVLASPIGAFEAILKEIAPALKKGSIVTDVGSTKVLPMRWARKYLPADVCFVGSHPMAGSEQRGIEFARADLFDGAICILTSISPSQRKALHFLKRFWIKLGLRVVQMTPTRHDRILARISHLPHLLAAALVNYSDFEELTLCGKGFLDSTRIASGPPGIWRDIVMSNSANIDRALERFIRELSRLQKALQQQDEKTVMNLLTAAQQERNKLVKKKLLLKELPA